jgi:hypothetical protein
MMADPFDYIGLLILEIALEDAHEAGGVASLVACHLMNAVVKCIKVVSLGNLGSLKLLSGSSLLSSHTHLHIGLGVVQDGLAKELSIAGSMTGLFHGIMLEGTCNLGIALAVSLTSHGQVHTDLTALALEGVAAVLQQFGRYALFEGDAQLMLSGKLGCSILSEFLELIGACATDGALSWCFLTFIDVTADGTNKLLLHNVFVFK